MLPPLAPQWRCGAGSGTYQRASSKPMYLRMRSSPPARHIGSPTTSIRSPTAMRVVAFAQREPERVGAGRFDHGPGLVVLQLDDGDARSVRRPAKLLARCFLQTVNLVCRHISIYSRSKQFAMECFIAARLLFPGPDPGLGVGAGPVDGFERRAEQRGRRQADHFDARRNTARETARACAWLRRTCGR